MEDLNIEIVNTSEKLEALQAELEKRKRELEAEERRLRDEAEARKREDLDRKYRMKAQEIFMQIFEQLGEDLTKRMEACRMTMECSAEKEFAYRRFYGYTGEFFLTVNPFYGTEKSRTFKVTKGVLGKAGVKFITSVCDDHERKIKRKEKQENYLDASGINDCLRIREQCFKTRWQKWNDEPTRVITIDHLPLEQMRQVVDLVNSFKEEA